MPQYEPLGHTPLLISSPGQPGGGVCDALTTNVDIFATVADVFDAEVVQTTHGRSMAPLLTGEADAIRDWALGGVYGGWVQVTDGQNKYARGAVGDNFPLSMWSNRWSTMPFGNLGFDGLPAPDHRAWLDKMPGSEVPVIRQPFQPGDMLPLWVAVSASNDRHFLFDLDVETTPDVCSAHAVKQRPPLPVRPRCRPRRAGEPQRRVERRRDARPAPHCAHRGVRPR